jgi:hypothetical protein
MPAFAYLLQPKYKLFLRHDERLRTRPQPVVARRKFKVRLRESARMQKIRLACLIGIYLTTITTIMAVVLQAIPGLGGFAKMVQILGGFSSTFAALFLLGAFLSNRALNYLEVDLYFYSQESRIGVLVASS